MKRYTYDFHVHSCLSPCADNDNTPNNIAGMASLCGIEIMALTDHNTSKNCPAFFEAARRYGIIPIGGMELTTAEDVHILCLFDTLEGAMAFDRLVDSRRVKIKNRPEIFGEQLILNGEDEPIGVEEDLLINATSISLEEVPELIQPYGGICYPAHIDREANGIIAVLGALPKTPVFSCVELHNAQNVSAYTEQYSLQRKKILISSDAHRLTDFRDENDTLLVDDEPYSSALVRRRVLDDLR